ncbi:MAG: hypothetical protein DCO96_08710 [Fluviicola sp. XM-24bin1]|nr:MAG: hypothetical protein DCO96_08710 [Fluviicola sp. XM-24bin1]
MKFYLSFVFLLLLFTGFSQDAPVYGHINIPNDWPNKVYLSVKHNYRDIDIVDASDIIHVTSVDSTGYFSFDAEFFAAEEKIYQIHVTPDSNEIEVFLSDYSKGGVGRNYLVLVTKQSQSVTLKPSNDGKIFGPISSANSNAGIWQKLDALQTDFHTKAYQNGGSNEDHFVANYHKSIRKLVEKRGTQNQLLACYYMLEENANLSPAYLESIRSHIGFIKKIEEKIGNKSSHANQLSKEIALIELQLNGQDTTSNFERINIIQTVIIIISYLIILILIVVIWRLRKRLKRNIQPHLTQQEKNIKRLILDGKSNKEIAEELFISVSTVKTHINTLYKKEGVSSRKELTSKNSTGV